VSELVSAEQLVPAGDLDRLYAAVAGLLSDPLERARCAAHGLQEARRFCDAETDRSYAAWFATLLGSARS
jgi:hypothetical protein